MSSDEIGEHSLFEDLRRLAAEQPREARTRVAQLLDDQPKNLGRLLDLIGLPGEGRLRHIFANAVIEKGARAEAVPKLRYWHDVETDEFTKKALRRALESIAKAPVEQSASVNNALVDQHFFEAYRYVQRRMMHRIANALGQPYEVIERMREGLSASQGVLSAADVTRLVDQLEERLRLVGRIIEFDVEDAHFHMRPIPIYDWLIRMNARYAAKHSAVGLEFKADARCRGISVYACDHFLEEIFWNLWVNAHQELRKNCRITVIMDLNDQFVDLKIVDNGLGFSQAARDAAFVYAYTSKKPQRGHSGQGLLEVRDAIERLHGKVLFVEINGLFHIMLKLLWVTT